MNEWTLEDYEGHCEESPVSPAAERQQESGGDSASTGQQEEVRLLSLRECLDGMVAFLRRYIVFPEVGQARVLALWAAHTWVKRAFDYTPYLHVFSPEKRCGKSRLLDCLELLCDTPWPVIAPTPATLFRFIEIECPTALIDEVDTLFVKSSDEGKEALRGILNAGFHVNGKVPRCVGEKHEIKNFSVFCPKVLAGIGRLPDTISDRCIPLQLTRRTSDQVVARFRRRDAVLESQLLTRSLSAWRDNSTVIDALRNARPDFPEEFSDRQADIIEPLLAISDMAGREWAFHSRTDLMQLCVSLNEPEESLGVKLLRDMRRIFVGMAVMPTANVISDLSLLDTDAPWAHWWGETSEGSRGLSAPNRLARMLKPFGITPTTIRITPTQTAKGYRRDDFQDAWARYCPRVPAEDLQAVTNVT
jgi:hypothetical protein